MRMGWVVLTIAVGCGDKDGGGPKVEGNARIVHGPTGTTSPLRFGPAPIPEDGHWAITPTSATLTFTSITFTGTDGQPQLVPLTDCAPTYTSAGAALSKLLDCPFEVPAGEYGAITLAASPTYQMVINDTTNGLFTDPASASKVVTTAPAGGAQPASFTVPGPGGTGQDLSAAAYLTEPLVVAEGTPVAIDLLVDMIHTISLDVSGGVATVDLSLPSLPAEVVPSASGTGRVAFYSQVASSVNMKVQPLGGTMTWGGARVFYAQASQPNYLNYPVPGPSQAYSVDPAQAPPNGTDSKVGGYLGVDSTNTMCWAMPTDPTYTTYSKICRMAVVSTVGATTTIECQATTTAPPPPSGATYASGCPPITPTMSLPVTLVAI